MGRRPRPTIRVEGDPESTRGGKPEAVRVWVLGGFRVSVGSRIIEEGGWRLRKAAALIKLLALEPDHRMHRERVTDLLWPDLNTKAAANNLYHALHIARRALGTAQAVSSRCLRLRDDTLWLCPDMRVWVDAEAFEEAARAARRASEPAAYRAALDLYVGDLLPGDLYEDWASDRREELRQLRLSLLVEMATLYEQRGKLGPAIEALGQAVGIEPTHEEAHAGLMRLYAASGRCHEALLQYERLKEALREVDSPGPRAEVRRLHEEILSERFSRTNPPDGASPEEPANFSNNLPLTRTSFVGWEREMLEVKQLLSMTRLLTLTGAGGSGKTRLALEIVRKLIGEYPGGVWLVELASLSEPELVQQEVAKVLHVREQPNRPLTGTLAAALRDKEMLLVLDNCEHLVDAVAYLADALLSACPKLRILATSREPLGVEDETRWPVPSLSVPDRSSAGDPARYEAVRLFVERARLKLPSFALNPKNARAVAEVCKRLDGLPLAIELATARVGALAVEQVAERLEDSLNLLDSGPRTAAPRHRTLRATLEWSHELLNEAEKSLFRRLSAFAGGWTLEAAEAICSGGLVGEGEILDLLTGLVDKSMVVAEVSADGHARYRMLEPVRQYAWEKLEESGEADAVGQRHAVFFLALAEEAEPQLRGAEQEAWLGRLEVEHDNLRAALSWVLDQGEAESALRLAGALGEFWHIRGHLSEGRRWLQASLERESTPGEARIKALARAGYLAWETSDYGRAKRLGEETMMLARELGDTAGEAAALCSQGMVALHEGRLEEASALLVEAAKLLRASGDAAGLARALRDLGFVEVARHDFERAVALYEEGLPLARETGDGLAVALMLGMGALAFLGLDDYQRVRDLCAEAMELSRRLGHSHSVAFILQVLAALAGASGQPVLAARLWGQSEAICEEIGVETLSPVERRHYAPYLAAARGGLGESAWQTAWAEGRAMSIEEATGYALSREEPSLPLRFARVKALARAGYLAWETSDYEQATTLSEEALALARELGDTTGEAAALYNLGAVATLEGRLEEASASFGEGVALLRTLDDEVSLARALQGLGLLEIAQHNYERAVMLYQEGLPLARKTDDSLVVVLMLGMGALAFLELGNHRRARDLCAEAMELSQRLGHLHAIAFILHVLAALAGTQGQHVRAARLWAAAEALREAIGIKELAPIEHRHYGPYIADARDRLDEPAWEAAWAEGRAMTPEQAAAYALPAEEPTLPLRSARVKALARAGDLAWEQGDFERAIELSEEGLALARESGDEASAAANLINLGTAMLLQEKHARARVLFEEAVELQRESDDKAGLARALQALGMAVMALGDLEHAESLYEESLALARESGHIKCIEASRLGLALNALAQHDYERVRRICVEVLQSSQRLNYGASIYAGLNLLASAVGSEGQAVRAARLWGASEAMREALGKPDLSPIERSTFAPHMAAARSRLNETAWEAAWAEGRAMSVEEATDYALSEEELASPICSARIKTLAKAGWIAWEQSNFERSIALSEEGLALARKSGDEAGAAANLINLGVAMMLQGETERATAHFEESLPLLRELGDKRGLAHSILGLGMVAVIREDYGRARSLSEECLQLFREAGDAYGIALTLNHLGLLALLQEDYVKAEDLYKKSLKLSRPSVTGHNITFSLHISAALAGSQGRPVRAARLWGAAEALREKTGQGLSPVELRHYGPYIATARARLGEAAWEAAWAEGRAMVLKRAIEYALSEEEPDSPMTPAEEPLPATRPLTRREREVVSLIAHSLPNRRIADTLSISLSTVENHVRNVLKKLGLRSRQEVAAWENERRRRETDRI